MKKSDLKNGAVVITRDGEKYLKVDDILFSFKMNGSFLSLKYFDDNLNNRFLKNNDIVKVYNTVSDGYRGCSCAVYNHYLDDEPTWERIDILDDKEREYLLAVIKPFINRVIDIQKREYYLSDNQYIIIRLKTKQGYDNIVLPDFKKNTMYKGMKADRGYTLEELKL